VEIVTRYGHVVTVNEHLTPAMGSEIVVPDDGTLSAAGDVGEPIPVYPCRVGIHIGHGVVEGDFLDEVVQPDRIQKDGIAPDSPRSIVENLDFIADGIEGGTLHADPFYGVRYVGNDGAAASVDVDPVVGHALEVTVFDQQSVRTPSGMYAVAIGGKQPVGAGL